MPLKLTVEGGDGGKAGTLRVQGAVAGGIGNEFHGAPPPPQSLKTDLDNAEIKVKGLSGTLEADSVNVGGLVEGGIDNVHHNVSDAEKTNDKGKEVRYKMDAEPRGMCYIFNNKNFEGSDTRSGTDKDRDDLKRVFEKLKFTVKTFDDSDADYMEIKIRKLSEMSHAKYDCVVVIFLTHGKDGAVKGKDNDWLQIKQVTSFFRAGGCPTLANKPKLFFFQSCRGAMFQKGTKAVRNVETGSWYIQELVRVLEECADKEDLLSMMTTVQSRVNDHKYECTDGTFLQQTAECTTRLMKKLYF